MCMCVWLCAYVCMCVYTRMCVALEIKGFCDNIVMNVIIIFAIAQKSRITICHANLFFDKCVCISYSSDHFKHN